MSQPIKWREKRDSKGSTIPNCWVTDSGYTVAECRLPESRYTITRPGSALPFAYTGDRDDVLKLIGADIGASADADRLGVEVDPCA